MKHYAIHSRLDHQTLYEGAFESFTACLEQAVTENTGLAGADLSNRNLVNACLDDATLTGADLSGCNLTGANLSEARLAGAIFTDSDLYNTCFAYADLTDGRMEGCWFGGTDIAGCDIAGCRFSTLSCFSLDFAAAGNMANCRFTAENGGILEFSRPPVVIRGIGRRVIVFTEKSWLHGMSVLPYPENINPLKHLAGQIKSSQTGGG